MNNDLHYSIISKQTRLRLAKHGLKLDIEQDAGSVTELNRNGCATFFMGADCYVYEQDEINTDAATNVAEVLAVNTGDNINDVIWELVDISKPDNGNGTAYTIGDAKKGWAEQKGGFISIRKSTVLNYYGVTELTDDLIAKTRELFVDEVRDYDDWVNGRVYAFLISSTQPSSDSSCPSTSLSDWYDGLRDRNGSIDTLVNKVIDEVIRTIDKDDTPKMVLTLKADETNSNFDETLNAIYVINKIKCNLNFTPTIGSIIVDDVRKELTLNILTASIPPFLKLAANATSSDNIFHLMERNIKEVGSKWSGVVTDAKEAHRLLTENLNYLSWSEHMMQALALTIVKNIDGMTLAQANTHKKININKHVEKFIDRRNNTNKALLIDVIAQMGGYEAFSEVRKELDETGRTLGVIGFARVEEKMTFFNQHQAALKLAGRAIASKENKDSLVEMASEQLSKYGYNNLDVISDALNEVHTDNQEGSGDARKTVGTWLVKLFLDEMFAGYKAFCREAQ